MVHIALKLRADILAHPKYQGFVNEEEMIACVPESVFTHSHEDITPERTGILFQASE